MCVLFLLGGSFQIVRSYLDKPPHSPSLNFVFANVCSFFLEPQKLININPRRCPGPAKKHKRHLTGALGRRPVDQSTRMQAVTGPRPVLGKSPAAQPRSCRIPPSPPSGARDGTVATRKRQHIASTQHGSDCLQTYHGFSVVWGVFHI